MKKVFENILDKYVAAKNKEFKNNELAKYIRIEAVDVIKKSSYIDDEQYRLEGSPGKGNWASVPWIAVFDRDITISASEGYDIVYLLRADMTGVYLSLNQGYTYFKKKFGPKIGKQKIKHISNWWQESLSSVLDDFNFEEIDLRSSTLKGRSNDLVRGYELGHILGKFYSAKNIPEDTVLINDLRNMLGVFRELKGRIGEETFQSFNKKIFQINEEKNILLEKDRLDLDKYKLFKLNKKEIPNLKFNKEKIKFNISPVKRDYIEIEKNKQEIGLIGEKIIIEQEKKYLIGKNRKYLADKIRHVSILDSDGEGYDILSFDENGKKKYIEVKATLKNVNEAFYISDNELQFSKKNQEQYYLYRLYNIDKKTLQADFYVLFGNMYEKLNIEPIVYKAKPK